MARPYERLPAGAKSHLEAMASNGLLSESAAATSLGMPLHEFRKVIKRNKEAAEIWDNALSIERDMLLSALYDKATSGDARAAERLLAIRHGMTEKNADNTPAERLNIIFQLPAALTPDQYEKLIKQTPKQVTEKE